VRPKAQPGAEPSAIAGDQVGRGTIKATEADLTRYIWNQSAGGSVEFSHVDAAVSRSSKRGTNMSVNGNLPE
jgi:hypothetical protein